MEEKAIQILQEITKYGYQAYIVGGYPRDRYLKRNTLDIDICTNAPLSLLKELFVVIKTEFLSSVIEYQGVTFEVTAFRKDLSYEKHRFPKEVKLVNTLEEDLQRRDFIMNTLCIDYLGNDVDLLGAKQDLDHKIIRTVGDASKKIEEDALRILRAIRFASQLNFKIEDHLLEVMKEKRNLVNELSIKRIKQELSLIENSSYADYGKRLLDMIGLTEIITKKLEKHIQ